MSNVNLERDVQHRVWIDKYRQTGDRWYLDKLTKAVDGMCHEAVRRFVPNSWHEEYDDYLQEAYIGAVNSVNSYDPSRKENNCWRTFAWLCISTQTSKYYTYLNRKKHSLTVFSTSQPIEREIGERFVAEGLHQADPFRFEGDVQLNDMLVDFMGRLNEKQKSTLMDRLKNKTFRQIAEEVQLSFQAVHQRGQAIKRKFEKFQLEQEAA